MITSWYRGGRAKQPRGALVVVNSPFQALVATELATRQQWEERASLVLLQPLGIVCDDWAAGLQQMRFVAQQFRWRDIVEVHAPQNVYRRRARSLQIGSQVLRSSTSNTLVIGTIHRRYEPFLSWTTAKRVVVLDDGMAALRYDEFTATYGRARQHRSRFQRLLRDRFDFADPRCAVEFFSAIRTVSGSDIVVNDLRWIATKIEDLPIAGETWLVGQPLVEQETMTDAQYLAAFGISLGSGRSASGVVYFPHPREDPEAATSRAAALGATIATRRAPLELEPLLRRGLPAAVVGIYSTALLSLRRVLPAACEVRMTPLRYEDLNDPHAITRISRYRAHLAEQLEASPRPDESQHHALKP